VVGDFFLRFDPKRLLKGWAYSTLLILTVVPTIMTIWSVGPRWESQRWPVLIDSVLVSEAPAEDGVRVVVEFTKLRDCRIKHVIWYDGLRALETTPYGRPPDDWLHREPGRQISNELHVHGISSLAGTHATVKHRCHPLWLTTSQYYP
jgi:hypothetical protein